MKLNESELSFIFRQAKTSYSQVIDQLIALESFWLKSLNGEVTDVKSFRVWSISLGVAVAASLFPMEKPLSGERVADNFGSCLIDQALSADSLTAADIVSSCTQSFDQSQNLAMNPWASVGQCYDAFQTQAPTQQAALVVFRGCSWFFKGQQA